MANGDDVVKCPLLKMEIDIGLCAEILFSGTLIRKSAVPEIDQFTQEEVNQVCASCPYGKETD